MITLGIEAKIETLHHEKDALQAGRDAGFEGILVDIQGPE